jgi:hypothetical protein
LAIKNIYPNYQHYILQQDLLPFILITEWSARGCVTIFMTMFGLQCEKQQ